MEGDRQIVDRLYLLDALDIESAAATVVRVLLPCVVEGNRLGVERRAIVKLHTGAELVGPRLVVVGMRPGFRELGDRLAAFVEPCERVEDQRCGGFRRGVVDAHFEGIEARDIELEADRDAAALFLGRGGAREYDNCAGGERDARGAAAE